MNLQEDFLHLAADDAFGKKMQDLELLAGKKNKISMARWPTIAKEIGISRIEQEMMAGAFKA